MTRRGMFASQQLRQLHSLWFCTAVFPQCIELYFRNALHCISAIHWIVFLQCTELCFCNALNCIYAMHCCISTCTELYFWNTLNCISAMNWIVFLKHTELYFRNALNCISAMHWITLYYSNSTLILNWSVLQHMLIVMLMVEVVLLPSSCFLLFCSFWINTFLVLWFFSWCFSLQPFLFLF